MIIKKDRKVVWIYSRDKEEMFRLVINKDAIIFIKMRGEEWTGF